MEKQYIALLSEQVERKTVSYKNRYGMELVGELYTAKNMDVTEKHPAIIPAMFHPRIFLWKISALLWMFSVCSPW